MHKIKYIGAVLIAVAGLGLQHAQATLSGSIQFTLPSPLSPAEELDFIRHTGPSKAVLLAQLSDPGDSTPFFTLTVISANTWNVNWNLTNVVSRLVSAQEGTSVLLAGVSGPTGTTTYLPFTVIDNEVKSGGATVQFVPGGPLDHISFFGFATTPDGGTTVMLLGAALGALGMARRFLKI
jgi:hypothetical protein